jgi:hypothetical protein
MGCRSFPYGPEHQLMVHLDRNLSAPVAPQMPASQNRQPQPQRLDREPREHDRCGHGHESAQSAQGYHFHDHGHIRQQYMGSARAFRFRAFRRGRALLGSIPVKTERHPTERRAHPRPSVNHRLVDYRCCKVAAAVQSEACQKNATAAPTRADHSISLNRFM